VAKNENRIDCLKKMKTNSVQIQQLHAQKDKIAQRKDAILSGYYHVFNW